MNDLPDAEHLFDHLQKFLGQMRSRWHGTESGGVPFDVFVYDCPFADHARVLVTFGLSAHHFAISGSDNVVVRRELLICATEDYNPKQLSALLVAVGLNDLGTHVAQPLHSVLRGEGPVLSGGNPRYEHLYLSLPIGFPLAFAKCEECEPRVQIIQIVPISERENRLISTEGCGELQSRLEANIAGLLKFDKRIELA